MLFTSLDYKFIITIFGLLLFFLNKLHRLEYLWPKREKCNRIITLKGAEHNRQVDDTCLV